MAEQKKDTNPINVFVVLLTLMFAFGKVFGVGVTQTWSWWAVLSPVLIWFGFGLFIGLFLIVVAVGATLVKKK